MPRALRTCAGMGKESLLEETSHLTLLPQLEQNTASLSRGEPQ